MTPKEAPTDREVALVAACCRWPRDPAAVTETERLIEGVDGPRLLRIARRHRVLPLVHETLRPCGDGLDAGVREKLRGEAEEVRRACLALAAESLRLHHGLASTSVRHLFVKGEGLARVAYGRLGLKAARDIDLLYFPEDFDAASACMIAAGYEQIEPFPRLTTADRRLWLRLHKDSVWRHRGTGLLAELHHRLTLSPHLLSGINAASPSMPVELARGQTIPLLNVSDHYVYLCVHGALSGWSRLKWLSDVNALLNAHGTPPITTLHAAAERHGVAGTSHLAIVLMARLFARPTGIELADDMAVDRAADQIVAALTGAQAEREPRKGALAALRLQSSLSRLTSVKGQRWALLPLTLVSFRDRAALRLPRALSPLYWIIRFPSAITRGLFARR